MAQPIENQLTDEDFQILNINRLGTPTAVYKVKSICIYILRSGGFFLLGVGLTMIALGLYENKVHSYDFYLMYIGVSIVSLLVGIYTLRVELPRVQTYRIIVCEHGLLETKEQPRRRKIEVVYWRDVLTIRRLHGEYYITQRGHDAFTLTILYQHAKELAAYIKLRSSLPVHMQQAFVAPEEMYPPLREKPPE